MKFGKLFGVQLRINPFFLLIIALCALSDLLPEALIVFGVTLMHELAHVSVAKGYGLKVREIELLPFGGVARIDNIIDANPAVETSVALAGPVNNLCLVLVAITLQYYHIWDAELGHFFVQCNLAQALFNLIPAFPLDGGRIYRAMLARRFGFKQATERAVKVSQVLAIVMVFAGIAGIIFGKTNLFPVIIAVLLFSAAAKEKGMAIYAVLRHLTHKKETLFTKGVLATEQLVVTESTLIRDVINYFMADKYHTFLILSDKYNVIGMITETEVVDGLVDYGLELPLSQLFERRK